MESFEVGNSATMVPARFRWLYIPGLNGRFIMHTTSILKECNRN